MAGSLYFAKKMCRILSKVSDEMQAVVAKKMHLTESVTETDIGDYQSQSWIDTIEDDSLNMSKTGEVDLQDDILNQMEYIITCRQEIFKKLESISSTDPRKNVSNQLLQKVEELETRAVIFLTIPPQTVTGNDCDSSVDEIQIPFNRFLIEAAECIDETIALIECTDVDAYTKEPPKTNSIKSDLTSQVNEKVKIPGFSYSDAVKSIEASNNAISKLLSDPQSRSSTSLVKLIIGCACSQITRNDPEHCLNRLNYLLTFFSGSMVRPPGVVCNHFSISNLPTGLGDTYSWHCLMNAALAQAEHQFAYSLDSSLPFATVLATLLARYPNQVPNCLSRFVLACPLLSSYADINFLSSDPTISHPSEIDLLKWKGVARLFAAVTISQPPPGITDRPAYLNPKTLWLVIAGLINRPFIPCATAQVLCGLLEVGGFALKRLYKRQADRLILTIMHTINRSEVLSQSPPELALLTILETSLETGTFPGGTGMLMEYDWT